MNLSSSRFYKIMWYYSRRNMEISPLRCPDSINNVPFYGQRRDSFSSPLVQTGAQLASYLMGKGGSYPGHKEVVT